MRRLSLALYLLVALAEVVHWAIVPLLPAYADKFSLSSVETSALVASTGLATLVISPPAGLLADRLGARRLTLLAGAALAAGALGHAIAPSYATLMVARLVFGLAFGIVWTTGLAWLSQVRPVDESKSALGASVTSAGIGVVVAPGFAGVVAENVSLGAPFLIAGIVTAIVVAVLATAPAGQAPEHADAAPTLTTLRVAGREPGIVAALVAILLGGMAGGVFSVVVPLELHEGGFSEADIGVAFSSAALIFIVASAVVVARGDALITVGAVLAGGTGFLLALTPATLSGAAVAVICAMCLTAPVRALLYTVSYPLGASRAGRAGVGAGMVLGLLNSVWALTTVVGPLGSGALLEIVGERATYALLQGIVAAALLYVWVLSRRATPAPLAGAAD
jgi:predicted MFS family arabinose efflux permease